jgi:hypothetical protein
MSGVAIAGELLRGSMALTTFVPVAQIKAWELPQGTTGKSIVVKRVSRRKHQFLDAQQVWLVTERVQATVRAGSGADRETIVRLGERACADKTGTIAGFGNVAVQALGAGPDFMDEAGTVFMGSFDLQISFNEPA